MTVTSVASRIYKHTTDLEMLFYAVSSSIRAITMPGSCTSWLRKLKYLTKANIAPSVSNCEIQQCQMLAAFDP